MCEAIVDAPGIPKNCKQRTEKIIPTYFFVMLAVR